MKQVRYSFWFRVKLFEYVLIEKPADIKLRVVNQVKLLCITCSRGVDNISEWLATL